MPAAVSFRCRCGEVASREVTSPLARLEARCPNPECRRVFEINVQYVGRTPNAEPALRLVR